MNRKGLIDDIGDVNREKAEVNFIYDRIQKPDDSVITKQLKALEKLGGVDKKTKESKTHHEIIHDFINRNNIVTIKVIENIKTKKLREIKAAKYELFINMLGLEDTEQSRGIFNSLLPPNSTTIDIRHFILNCIACMHFSNIDKSKWAFTVFDHEDSSYISFEDILNILAWINLETNPNTRAVYLRKIFQEKKLEISEPISKAQYDKIFNQFQTIFFNSISKKLKEISQD